MNNFDRFKPLTRAEEIAAGIVQCMKCEVEMDIDGDETQTDDNIDFWCDECWQERKEKLEMNSQTTNTPNFLLEKMIKLHGDKISDYLAHFNGAQGAVKKCDRKEKLEKGNE